MRIIMILLLSLLVTNLSLYASKNTQKPLTITKLIQKIKKAPSEDRRILMNQLKITLRKTNAKTRQKVMKELQRSFASQKRTQSMQPSSQISSTVSPIQGMQQGKMQHATTIPLSPQRQIVPTSLPVQQPSPVRPSFPGMRQQRGPR